MHIKKWKASAHEGTPEHGQHRNIVHGSDEKANTSRQPRNEHKDSQWHGGVCLLQHSLDGAQPGNLGEEGIHPWNPASGPSPEHLHLLLRLFGCRRPRRATQTAFDRICSWIKEGVVGVKGALNKKNDGEENTDADQNGHAKEPWFVN